MLTIIKSRYCVNGYSSLYPHYFEIFFIIKNIMSSTISISETVSIIAYLAD